MSLLKELNITDKLMRQYSPLSQLSDKYLAQVLKQSSIVTFEAGEQLFEKNHALHSLYYLLAGTLKIKKGVFSSDTLEASSPECKNAINNKIPDGVSVKALEKGHMLLIEEDLLDRALGWSEAEQVKRSADIETEAASSLSHDAPSPIEDTIADENALQSTASNDVPEKDNAPKESFDEEHFSWITSLMEFPLFFNLPPSNMERLFQEFKKVPVSGDEVVIKEGEEGDYFYLLIEGSARVIIGGDESRPIRLNKGSYFGEEALISNTVRSATVIMNEDGLLARLDKQSFQSFLNDPMVQHVTKKQFNSETQDNSDYELLDIRSLTEFEFTPLPKCMHIPLAQLREKIPTLDKSKVYYLTEEGGHRSDVAAHILCQKSFKAKVIRS